MPMFSSSRQVLLRALLASALLHLVLLMRFDEWKPISFARLPAQLNATLLADGRSNVVSPVAEEVSQAPAKLRISPAASNVSAPQVPVSAPRKRRSADTSRPPVVRSVASHSMSAATTESQPVRPESSSGTTLSINDLAEYRLALGLAIKTGKDYPRLAREKGWEGVVGLELQGAIGFTAPELTLVRSSGQPILDEHALGIVAQALRVTALPVNLRGRVFRFPLVVSYRLDEPQ